MGIVLGHHIGDPAISLQATTVTLMPMIESSFHDDPIHQVKHIEDFIENEPEFEVNGLPYDNITEEKSKIVEWDNRKILEEHRMRPSHGFLQSTFIATLKSVSEKSDLIREKAHETVRTAKEKFDINIEKNANILKARLGAQRLKRMLSTICEYKKDASHIVREKRFVGALFLFLFVTISSYGIAAAVATSSRVINLEDVELEKDVAEEKLALNEIEIKRLEMNSGNINEIVQKVDVMEHKIALDNYGRYLEHSATSAIRELSFYTNPDLWLYEESPFLEKMSLDIRSFYSSKHDEDLFQNVIGNGISEVLYLTSFKKVILQEAQNNDCKDASVMLLATTIHPMREISGTKTEIFQQYKTDVGNKFFYINEKYIAKGTNYRPEESLAAQRLVMTSASITATVLNNTVFQIHSSTPLKVNITCPNTTKTVTLFNSPMMKLNISCSITSPHLNISSFYQEYQEDFIADKFGLFDFDKSDYDLDFLIGYQHKPLTNTNDMTEMHKMAHEIFVKQTQITQNEMEALENDPPLGKMIRDAGNVFVGWFKEALHHIALVIAVIVGAILVIISIFLFIKCGCCCKKN